MSGSDQDQAGLVALQCHRLLIGWRGDRPVPTSGARCEDQTSACVSGFLEESLVTGEFVHGKWPPIPSSWSPANLACQ